MDKAFYPNPRSFLSATLIIAASIIIGAFVMRNGDDTTYTLITAASIYGLAPIAAAIVAWRMGQVDSMIIGAAILLTSTIFIPGALLDPQYWSQVQLSSLGSTAGIFFILMLPSYAAPKCFRRHLMATTAFLALIMVVLTFLL